MFEYFCFRKSVQEIRVSLKSEKNSGTLHEDRYTFMMTSRLVLLRARNFSDKRRDNRNIHFVFSNFIFRSHAVYEITWDNIVQRGSPQMTIWRMHIACWVTKATNTHSQYEILISFPLQQWLHERPSK